MLFKVSICLVMVALLFSSTVAVAPCDAALIAKLKTISECYTNGKAPSLSSVGGLGTHVVYTKGDLPTWIKCVTASQDSQHAYVTYYNTNGSNLPITLDHIPKGDYLLESGTVLNGLKYRMYVIHNEKDVYSYYRCLDGTTGGTGTHMADVAVGCKFVESADSLAVIQKAKSCFIKLGITNVLDLTPCTC